MGGWYIAGRTKMNKDAKDGQRCEGWKKMRKMILEIHRMDGIRQDRQDDLQGVEAIKRFCFCIFEKQKPTN